MSMDSFGELLLVAERRKVAVWSLNTGSLVKHIDLEQPEGLDLTQVQITGKCGQFHGALVVMMMEELEDDTAEDHISTDYRISSYTWKSDKDHSKFELEDGSLDLHQVDFIRIIRIDLKLRSLKQLTILLPPTRQRFTFRISLTQ